MTRRKLFFAAIAAIIPGFAIGSQKQEIEYVGQSSKGIHEVYLNGKLFPKCVEANSKEGWAIAFGSGRDDFIFVKGKIKIVELSHEEWIRRYCR